MWPQPGAPVSYPAGSQSHSDVTLEPSKGYCSSYVMEAKGGGCSEGLWGETESSKQNREKENSGEN